jgi:hypothetical protein
MGYAVIMKIYHELELDRFLNNKARHETFEYNTKVGFAHNPIKNLNSS